MNVQNKHLVAGLGNPGRKYCQTRHNVGFMVIDVLAARWKLALGEKLRDIDFGCCFLKETKVCLAKPLAYMNKSGPPIQQLADRQHFRYEDLIIVHDDIDLAFGTLKIKAKGGSGGHKGVRSIMETFGEGGFSRLRVGIGRPLPGFDVTDHVLGPFESSEREILVKMIDQAADAVHTIIREGILTAMNKFNRKLDVTDSTLDSR